ncbi:MAG TPA: 4Fe-4S binding protein [Desulfomonilia bacterium]|nr:4Fe-4S binding protein [Desulfomonilia bacterium]
MAQDIFKQLQERIDQYSVGMTASATGKEIAVLKRLFSSEEATVYLALSRRLEPVPSIAVKTGLSEEEAGRILACMTAKGLLFPKTWKGRKYYAAAPFMHGFFEHQLYRKDPDPELPGLIEDYLTGGFFPKTRSLRTIPIQAGLPDRKRILHYDDVRAIIRDKERIGLFDCACGHHLKTLGLRSCSHSGETCIAFDFYAEYPIEEIGYGRWINQNEALGVIDYAEEHGLVHQAGGDARNVECICNCCPDCCTILRFLKQLPNPGRVMSSNYVPRYDEGMCRSCGCCVKRCPMKAISLAGETMVINHERCIGCGLCVAACPSGARSLDMKPEDQVRRPPSPEKYSFMRSSIDFRADLPDEAK